MDLNWNVAVDSGWFILLAALILEKTQGGQFDLADLFASASGLMLSRLEAASGRATSIRKAIRLTANVFWNAVSTRVLKIISHHYHTPSKNSHSWQLKLGNCHEFILMGWIFLSSEKIGEEETGRSLTLSPDREPSRVAAALLPNTRTNARAPSAFMAAASRDDSRSVAQAFQPAGSGDFPVPGSEQ